MFCSSTQFSLRPNLFSIFEVNDFAQSSIFEIEVPQSILSTVHELTFRSNFAIGPIIHEWSVNHAIAIRDFEKQGSILTQRIILSLWNPPTFTLRRKVSVDVATAVMNVSNVNDSLITHRSYLAGHADGGALPPGHVKGDARKTGPDTFLPQLFQNARVLNLLVPR